MAVLAGREKEHPIPVTQMQSNRNLASEVELCEQAKRNYISSLELALGVTEIKELIRKHRAPVPLSTSYLS